jgi:outer membrane protein assembly factor BamB
MRTPILTRRTPILIAAAALAIAALSVSNPARAADWPQWRGPNGAGRATDFTPPATWPKTLTQQWTLAVGDGVATPALVGDKLYVFTREQENEVIRCVDATTGKEIWQDKYEARAPEGPPAQYPGPRSSPAVADGKVITLGVRGTLSCLDAATGKIVWRKDDFTAWPKFFVSSSPFIIDGLCIAQLGGPGNGAIVAYDLATGEQKWKSAGNSPDNASPSLMTVGDTKLIVAETDRKIVAVNAADGKVVWETPFAGQGMTYNASTPVVDGQTIIYSGGNRGTHAVKIEKTADGFTGKVLWDNPRISVQFNTPVVKDGLLFGLTSANELFCINTQTGQTAWSASIGGAGGMAAGGGGRGAPGAGPGPGGPGGGGGGAGPAPGPGGPGGPGGGGPGGRGGGGRGGRGGMGGGGGGRGFGSVVDAGSVLLALTPSSELIVFAPNEKAFTEQARIKVSPTQTYAYPIVSGDRLFIKDKASVTALSLK